MTCARISANSMKRSSAYASAASVRGCIQSSRQFSGDSILVEVGVKPGRRVAIKTFLGLHTVMVIEGIDGAFSEGAHHLRLVEGFDDQVGIDPFAHCRIHRTIRPRAMDASGYAC